jgi:hypothetical protein
VEGLQIVRVDVEYLLGVTAHLVFHLVQLLEREKALPDDAPRLVGVRVIADDLGDNHENRDK